jgi:hypothetical protein
MRINKVHVFFRAGRPSANSIASELVHLESCGKSAATFWKQVWMTTQLQTLIPCLLASRKRLSLGSLPCVWRIDTMTDSAADRPAKVRRVRLSKRTPLGKEASGSADCATFTNLNSEWFLDVSPGRVHCRQPGKSLGLIRQRSGSDTSLDSGVAIDGTGDWRWVATRAYRAFAPPGRHACDER